MKPYVFIFLIFLVGCAQYPESHTRASTEPKKIKKCVEKIAVVAVIDTGLAKSKLSQKANLCRYGHKDFTALKRTKKFSNTVDPVPTDEHGHGTNVAGIIQRVAGERNYCMVILKYYQESATGSENLAATIRAIKYAKKIGAKYINYSGGGSSSSGEEDKAVKAFLKNGYFIAAAGNDSKDLADVPYYPACYDGVIAVGNKFSSGSIVPSSNYGTKISRWEVGVDVEGFGRTMTGTSQATAVATGKIINDLECEK